MAQPREPRPDCGQDVDSSIAILNVGSVDENEDQETASVGQDVPLAALDLLARVKARYSTTLRCLHRLTIDHSGAGRGLAPFNLAQVHAPHRVDRFEQTGVAPGLEVARTVDTRGKHLGTSRHAHPLAAT